MVICVGVATAMALMQRTTFTAVTRVMERSPSFRGGTSCRAIYTDPEFGSEPRPDRQQPDILVKVLDEPDTTLIASKIYSFDIRTGCGKWTSCQNAMQLLRISVTDQDPLLPSAPPTDAREFGITGS